MALNMTLEEAKKSLEEEIELSNVTDLRQDLLPIVGRVTQNPFLRVLILKRGRPQAVLMSAKTYDLLKKVVNLFLMKAEEMSQQEKIAVALKRLIAERPSAAEHVSEAPAAHVLEAAAAHVLEAAAERPPVAGISEAAAEAKKKS